MIVDDGSSDNTEAVVLDICKLDQRIEYYKRPSHLPKGANACRNYGLDKSKGDFIQFFDSDDIMELTFLETKIEAFNEKIDFVISKTLDFIDQDSSKPEIINDYHYNFTTLPISHFNYASQKINWLTPDAMIKADIAKQIRFNEHLQRGQEYNYFVKLTAITVRGLFIDEFLTRRRLHDNSIKSNFDTSQKVVQAIKLRVHTLQDIYDITTPNVILWFVGNLAKNATLVRYFPFNQERYIFSKVCKYYGLKSTIQYAFARLSKLIFNKNEVFRKPIKSLSF